MADLKTHIAELEKRPERKVDTIEVQHLLVAHKDAGIGGVTRTLAEAEKLTGQLLDEILKGGNFDALVKQHTNDSHPGIYEMTKASRSGMVAAFGNVAWRLQVGETGVAPWDASASPFGWHIIKRLE